MLSAKTIEIVKQTAPVVADHAETITRRFYTLMFAGNPEVQAYFNPAHQHSGVQQRALAGAICAYAANVDNLAALEGPVELIAQKHCSLGIQPEHYPVVGKYLLMAIKDVLGDAATDEIIHAWSEAYGVLAEVFIDREQQIYSSQRDVAGGWNGYRKFLVQQKLAETENVSSFYLVPADGGLLPHYEPGQYITVALDERAPLTAPRNYSLSDRPGMGYFRISVKREVGLSADAPAGLVSNYLHDELHEGNILQVGPPCGEFTLKSTDITEEPIVFISGGIGITPVLAMFKHLAHCDWTAPVQFLHGARNGRSHVFAGEVRHIVERHSNFESHFRYDEPTTEDRHHARFDSEGLMDEEFLESHVPHDAHVYFCGPPPFMRLVYRALKARGFDESKLHFEFFGPKLDIGHPHKARPKSTRRRLQSV
ncbi:MAG TPA: NO-inducible flavohemoprotein [Lacipirellulaceae bacterium]|nr:NO-inducible flavohemoprotein [Lacipirellulaceae bacterium]